MATLNDSIAVTLNAGEAVSAYVVGRLRHEDAVRKGYEGNNKQAIERALRDSIGGCLAEVVLAKHLDVFWGGNLERFKKEPDVAGWDVRYTTYEDGCLLLQRHDLTNAKGNVVGDPPTRPVVLVTGPGPVFEIRGWLWGNEGQQPQYWRNEGKFEKRPCFAVRRSVLYPFPGKSKMPDRAYQFDIAPWTPRT